MQQINLSSKQKRCCELHVPNCYASLTRTGPKPTTPPSGPRATPSVWIWTLECLEGFWTTLKLIKTNWNEENWENIANYTGSRASVRTWACERERDATPTGSSADSIRGSCVFGRITITAALPVNENIYSVHCDHASVKCHHQLIWYTVIRQWGGHGVRHREETRRCLFFLHSVQNQTKSSRQTIVSLFLLLPTHVRVQSLCFYLQLVSKTLVPSSSPRGGTKTFLRGTKSTFVRALLLLLLDVRLQAVRSSWKRPPSDQRALKCSTPSCCENLLFGLENESLDILSNLLIIMKTSYSCHREERARGGEEQLTLASVFLHWSAFRPTFMTPAVLCWTNAVLPHQWSMHGSKYECDDLWALVITWGV